MSLFALTTNLFTFTSNTIIPAGGYDISEFANDPRGTPRVADWSDFENMDANQFDSLVQDLSLSDPFGGSLAFISWENSTFLAGGEGGNKYYRDRAGNGGHNGYLLHVNYNKSEKYVSYDDNLINSTPNSQKQLVITGLTTTKKILVVFSSTGSAVGDPHVKTFGGQKYTL